jgi:malonate-semialdehyde dehydrogenase (acetylating)/methylmalonate-semialdehyde dehydrogenase
VSTEIKRITHLVGGGSWTGVAERTSKVYNPATGQVTGELDLASAATVDEVVKVAHETSKAWAQTSLTKRAQVLFAYRELVNRDKERIWR